MHREYAPAGYRELVHGIRARSEISRMYTSSLILTSLSIKIKGYLPSDDTAAHIIKEADFWELQTFFMPSGMAR